MPNIESLSDPILHAQRFKALESATGQIPADAANLPVSTHAILANKTIAATQTTVAHGRSYTPKVYGIVMGSAGTVWESAAPDATNIYLTADSAGRICKIILGF